MYEVIVVPAVMCGGEIWVVDTKEKSREEAVKMRRLGTVLESLDIQDTDMRVLVK